LILIEYSYPKNNFNRNTGIEIKKKESAILSTELLTEESKNIPPPPFKGGIRYYSSNSVNYK
jgi:hypothetical protein